jgi:hypothetical protein
MGKATPGKPLFKQNLEGGRTVYRILRALPAKYVARTNTTLAVIDDIEQRSVSGPHV